MELDTADVEKIIFDTLMVTQSMNQISRSKVIADRLVNWKNYQDPIEVKSIKAVTNNIDLCDGIYYGRIEKGFCVVPSNGMSVYEIKLDQDLEDGTNCRVVIRDGLAEGFVQ